MNKSKTDKKGRSRGEERSVLESGSWLRMSLAMGRTERKPVWLQIHNKMNEQRFIIKKLQQLESA